MFGDSLENSYSLSHDFRTCASISAGELRIIRARTDAVPREHRDIVSGDTSASDILDDLQTIHTFDSSSWHFSGFAEGREDLGVIQYRKVRRLGIWFRPCGAACSASGPKIRLDLLPVVQ